MTFLLPPGIILKLAADEENQEIYNQEIHKEIPVLPGQKMHRMSFHCAII